MLFPMYTLFSNWQQKSFLDTIQFSILLMMVHKVWVMNNIYVSIPTMPLISHKVEKGLNRKTFAANKLRMKNFACSAQRMLEKEEYEI